MPTDAEVLQQLAEAAFDAGRPDVAGDLLRQASRCRPARPHEDAQQLHAEAVRMLAENRLSEAEAPLLRALQLHPTAAEWHEQLGVLFARQRRFTEAVCTFRVALKMDPAPARRWHHLALALVDLKQFAAAEGPLREAVHREPDAPDLRVALVSVLLEQKRHADAHAEATALIDRRPDFAHGWLAAGLVVAGQGMFEEAVPHFRKAAELDPKSADAHTHLAAALGKLRRWDEGEQAARAAIAANPNHAPAWGNLGNCLRHLGRYDEAGPALLKAVQLNPTDADASGNLALVLAGLGRHSEALVWYDRTVLLAPTNGEVRFNRALTDLTLGNFERGWPDYEHRWQTEAMRGKERSFPQPRWDGGDLTGKAIFLAAEQGLDDYIQFVRFAKPLADRGAKVIVQPPPELVELVRTVPGVSTVIDTPTGEATFHTWCNVMSVAGLLKVGLEDLRGEPYMTAPAAAVARWRERLAGVSGFKVGVCWQGNPKHTGDRWRSVKLERFAPLAAIPGVTLVSVQKGAGYEQLASAGFPITDVGKELNDFVDIAGLLMNLDLLVSIDSATAHLAGALGTRVWTLLPFDSDWRWLRDRTDTPWYRSMTLFRQPAMHDWNSVFAAVERELRATAAK